MKKKILIPLLQFDNMQEVLNQKLPYIPYIAPEEDSHYA